MAEFPAEPSGSSVLPSSLLWLLAKDCPVCSTLSVYSVSPVADFVQSVDQELG
jgi:hypothetical protein